MLQHNGKNIELIRVANDRTESAVPRGQPGGELFAIVQQNSQKDIPALCNGKTGFCQNSVLPKRNDAKPGMVERVGVTERFVPAILGKAASIVQQGASLRQQALGVREL